MVIVCAMIWSFEWSRSNSRYKLEVGHDSRGARFPRLLSFFLFQNSQCRISYPSFFLFFIRNTTTTTYHSRRFNARSSFAGRDAIYGTQYSSIQISPMGPEFTFLYGVVHIKGTSSVSIVIRIRKEGVSFFSSVQRCMRILQLQYLVFLVNGNYFSSNIIS